MLGKLKIGREKYIANFEGGEKIVDAPFTYAVK